MFAADGYYMLLEVLIWRKLYKPILSVKLKRDSPQGLSCGLRRISRPAYVLLAQHTFGVSALRKLGKPHLLGGLFRLGKIYGYDDFAALRVVLPNNILIEVGTAQISAVFAEPV